MNGRPNHFHRRNHGFTLIELMVGMLLGLIVIAGVASVFLANLRSYHSNEALSDVQSNARIAFELMARDIRQAGLLGCNSRSGRVANVLNNGPNKGGVAWWANWNNAVRGYDGTQANPTNPGTAVGNSAGDQVANTDSIILMGTQGTGLSVQTDKEPAASFKLNETTSDLKTGDIIVVCDPDHAAIVQISNYNNNNVTLVHNTGTVSPGNCSKGLGYPTDCGSTNGNLYTFGPNSRIAKMIADDWYIGVNPVDGRSLYRVALDNNDGTVAGTAQEMVRNVRDMQITYHQGNAATFVDATAVTNWSDVDAVRVALTLTSTNQRAGTDAQPLVRTFAATTTIRNRVN